MAKKIGIILAIFVVFYLGAHYWIRWRNTVTDDVTKISRLVDCDPNEVREVKISGESGGQEQVLHFRRRDPVRPGVPAPAQLASAEWEYVAPMKGESEAALLSRFASTLCGLYDPIPALEAESVFPGEGRVHSMAFTLEGGQAAGEHVLEFGRSADRAMSLVRYLGPGGGSRVVKIPSKLEQAAGQEPKAFLNTRVLRMAGDNIQSLVVFAGKKELFTLEREGEGWRVRAAGKDLGVGSEEASKYVNRLATLRAIAVDEEGLSPAACEQGASQVSIQVAGVGDRKEALFVQYGKTGPLTVCNTARDALFSIHRDLLKYLEPTAKSLAAQPQ